MKNKRIKIVLTILIILLFGIVMANADTRFFTKPNNKYAFANESFVIRKFNTIKEQKDSFLYLKSQKDNNNPIIITYDENYNIIIDNNINVYDNPFYQNPNNIKYSAVTITGECINSYITTDYLFIDKDETTKLNKEYYDKLAAQESLKALNVAANLDDYSNKIQKDGSVNDKWITSANEYWNKIPYNIRKRLIDDGWQLYVTDKDIAQTFFYGQYSRVAGVTVYYKNLIYFEDRQSAINISVAHEVGHAIDQTLGFISSSEEFINIYNQEKNNFVEVGGSGSQARGSSLEYFAESVQQYIYHGDSLKKNTPLTYQFIENAINSL